MSVETPSITEQLADRLAARGWTATTANDQAELNKLAYPFIDTNTFIEWLDDVDEIIDAFIAKNTRPV